MSLRGQRGQSRARSKLTGGISQKSDSSREKKVIKMKMWVADPSARGADLTEGETGVWGFELANGELHYATAEMIQGAACQQVR